MKILIAINDKNGMDSKLSEHFGHCSYFAIYEKELETLEIVENKLDHSNPDLTPIDQIAKFNPDIVFTLGIGGRAIELFNKKGIILKTGNYSNVGEVIENLNELKDLNSGCGH